jgi:hypothetical protein
MGMPVGFWGQKGDTMAENSTALKTQSSQLLAV